MTGANWLPLRHKGVNQRWFIGLGCFCGSTAFFARFKLAFRRSRRSKGGFEITRRSSLNFLLALKGFFFLLFLLLLPLIYQYLDIDDALIKTQNVLIWRRTIEHRRISRTLHSTQEQLLPLLDSLIFRFLFRLLPYLRLLLVGMSRWRSTVVLLESTWIEDYSSFGKSILSSFFNLLLQYFFLRKCCFTSFKAFLFGTFKHMHFVFNRDVLARSFQHKLRKFNVWWRFDCFTLILVCICDSLLSLLNDFLKKPNVIEMCVCLIPCLRNISFRLFDRSGTSSWWAFCWALLILMIRNSWI